MVSGQASSPIRTPRYIHLYLHMRVVFVYASLVNSVSAFLWHTGARRFQQAKPNGRGDQYLVSFAREQQYKEQRKAAFFDAKLC